MWASVLYALTGIWICITLIWSQYCFNRWQQADLDKKVLEAEAKHWKNYAKQLEKEQVI